MAKLTLRVSLLSGEFVSVAAAPDTALRDLRRRAERKLARGIAALVWGARLLEESGTLQEAGLQDGDALVATVQGARIETCRRSPAFFLVRGDGSVLTWGDCSLGVPELKAPRQICACSAGFAAVAADGSVLTWGHRRCCLPEADLDLGDVKQLCATEDAFAALRGDGSVATWGCRRLGGDSRRVQSRLRRVRLMAASLGAFCAVREDGTAVMWGSARYGARSSAPELRDARQLVATKSAFAALQGDGSVRTWGVAEWETPEDRMAQICASEESFAGIRLSDGAVVTWGGASSSVDQADVVQIAATRFAFAALTRDGRVVAWGHPRFGGACARAKKIRDARQLFASCAAFAVLRADGSVVTWGDARFGGESLALQEQLQDIRKISRLKRRFFEGEPVESTERPTVEDLRWMRLIMKAGGGIFKEKVMPSMREINELLRTRTSVFEASGNISDSDASGQPLT
ncbi:unnamed protein product [Effrenium voratum]|uniref:Ubiquitin-like domain-containing protein n=1 Tax=Effrenium voratum TaxID=2562239 RepID=A0AA36JE17_9DINO|nr:unnamed protein product [Effrenium voratum]